MDGGNGSLKWEFLAGGDIQSSPAIAHDGTVYVGSHDNKLYALNGKDGSKQWEFASGGIIFSSPAIGPGGQLYFGGYDGKVCAMQGSAAPVDTAWSMFGQNALRSGLREGSVYALVAGDGDSGNAAFRIEGNNLVAQGPFNYEAQASYSVRIQLTPTAGGPTEQVFTVQVNDVVENEPVFTSPAQLYHEENSLSLVSGTVTATDADGDILSYSIAGGTDQTLFTIDSQSGEISINTKPDFESPGDADGNNVYLLVVTVTDGIFTIPQDVTVKVVDGVDIQITHPTIGENQPAEALAGTLSLVPPLLEGIDPASNGTKLWEFSTSNLIPGSPAIGQDGTVYIGSYNRRLYALDGETGALKWSFNAGSKVYSSPAVAPDGTVYVGTSGNKLLAINGTEGTQLWEFQADGALYSSPAIGTDGTVYIGDYVNKVYAVDGSTGTQKWAFTAGGFILSSPAIALDGTVYFGSGDKKVYALDGTDGSKLWEFQTGAPVRSSPALATDGMVYIGSDDNKLYALDGSDGTKAWEFLAGGTVTSSPAVGTDGTIFVGGNDNKVYALEGSTGTLEWEFLAGGEISSSPAIAHDNTIYVGSNDQKLYALDATNGTKKWEFATGGVVFSSPAIGQGGQIYAGSYDGKVYALQGSSAPALSAWPMAGQNPQSTRQWAGLEFELVAGEGDTGNGAFRIEGPNLVAQAPLDFETQDTYSVRIKGTHTGGIPDQGVFTITVTDNNDAPTFTSPSSFSFQENSASLEIGTDTATDQDGDLPSFAIIGGADQAFFSIGAQDGILSLNVSPDYGQPADADADNVFQVTVQATDGALATPQDIAIYVTDDPADGGGIFLADGSIDENQPAGALAGTLHFTAPYVQNLDPASVGTKLWEFSTDNMVPGSPAISQDGIVYTGSYSKHLYALEATTGNLQWAFNTSSKIYSSPAVASDGTVYVGTADNQLFAIDGADGTPKWEYLTGGALYSSPAIGSDGTVFIGDYDNKVYAIDGLTGAQKWVYTTGGYILSSPAIGQDGTVFVGSGDKKVYALDGSDGTLLWEFTTGAAVQSSPALGLDGTVYIGSDDNKLYALDSVDGTKVWEFLAEDKIPSSPAIAGDGSLYFGCNNGKVYAANGTDGTKIWEFMAGGPIGSSPAIAQDGTVYVGSNDTKLYALDGANGTQKWEYATGGVVFSSPAIGQGGQVCFGSYEGKVYALQGSATPAGTAWPMFGQGTGRTGQRAGHVFELVAGDGDSGNASFQIEGNQLLALGPFDYEAQSSYSVRVQFTPVTGTPVAQVFTVKVADVVENEPVFTSPGQFNHQENSLSLVAGTAIATDADGDTLTYSITGGDDQALFTIDAQSGEISFNANPDYESPGDADVNNAYLLQVPTSDGIFTIPQDITINVVDGADIQITNPTIGENLPTGSLAGILSLSPPPIQGIDPTSIGTKLWEFSTNNLVPGSPAVGHDGTVYIGSYNRRLYAIDGETGAQQWNFNAGSKIYSSPAVGSDGTVYVGTSGSKLFAINGTDGSQTWEFLADAPLYSSPAIATDGTVHIGDYGNKVYAVNGTTGTQKWAFTAGGYILSSPAIATDGTVFVGSGDKKVYALDGDDGSLLWEYTTGGPVRSSPTLGTDGTVYIGSDDKKLYALDGTDGSKKWEFVAGGTVTSSAAIGADGTVYVGGNDSKAYALDGTTGALVWEFLAGGAISSSPAIADDGTVYVGSNDQKLYALDSSNGTKKWDFTTGGNVFSSPVIGHGGQVYTGAYDGKVYALQGASAPALSPWPMAGQNPQRTRQPTNFGFELVSGDGDIGNGAFIIEGTNLISQAPLDFETQASYSIRVKGTPAAGNTTERVFTITVTDNNDAPAITSPTSFSFQENSATLEVGTVTASDQDGDQPSFAIVGGPDQGFFSIGVQDGIFSFNVSPDFEQPQDTDGDNVFQLTVQATDSSLSTTQDISVTITNDPADAGGIFLAGGSINENQPDGSLAGTLHMDAPFLQNLDPGTIGTKLWEFNTNNLVPGSHAISQDGTVYIGSYNKKLYALDGVTGSQQWVFPAGGKVYSSPAIGADGTVYVGTAENKLFAIDGAAGTQLWEFLAGGALYSSPAIGPDGTVHIGSYDNKVYAINGSTGVQKWVFTAGGYILSSPAIGQDGTVFVGSGDTKVYALDGTDESLLWEFTNGSDVQSSPAIGQDGTVYIGSNSNNLYALDGTDGTLKWEFLAGGKITSSPAIGQDGTVYVGDHANKIYALDNSNGTPVWEFQAGDKINSSPAIALDGTIYVGSNDAKVYALDGADGTMKWEFTAGGTVFSSPVIGQGGQVYVGSYDGKVYALQGPATPAVTAWPMFGQGLQRTGHWVPPAFQFVAGDGDSGNTAFRIEGNRILAESPFDYETQSSYSVRVQYTPATGGAVEQIFTVKVADVVETPPAFTSPSTFNHPEHSAATLVGTVIATDPDGDSPSYSITGGSDQALFTIDAQTGEVSFLSSKDYDSPGDADGNNAYLLQVSATDGIFTVPQDITITIVDATEIQITNPNIAENEPIGSLAGVISLAPPPLQGIDPADLGTKLWEFSTNNLVTGSPAIGADGTI